MNSEVKQQQFRAVNTAPASPTSIDAYIATFTADIQRKLQAIRAEVKSLAPAAEERIAYGIPTFSMGRNLFHFAGFKGHIGLYPGAAAIEAMRLNWRLTRPPRGPSRFP